jgi:hypothetical protein
VLPCAALKHEPAAPRTGRHDHDDAMRGRGKGARGSIVASPSATGEEDLVDGPQLLASQDEPLPWPARPLLARRA